MQQPVTKTQFQAAIHSVQKITVALDALRKLDRQALNFDDDAIDEAEEFIDSLDRIRGRSQAIIDTANRQYDNRPVDLINRACQRLMHAIPSAIVIAQKSLQGRIDARESQAAELRLRGFAEDQIDMIAPPIGSDEISLSYKAVNDLKTEATKIEAFLADAPRYSLELLAGTSLIEQDNV